MRGQRNEAALRRLGSVFTLCAHAHQRAATLALAAAQGQTKGTARPPVALWLETARDHLRSMALDWPQRLPEPGAAGPDLHWLHGCLLPLVARQAPTNAAAALAQLGQLRVRLEDHILGQTIHQWQQANAAPEALAAWCQALAERLPPARFLSAWYPLASRLHLPAHSLQVRTTSRCCRTVT